MKGCNLPIVNGPLLEQAPGVAELLRQLLALADRPRCNWMADGRLPQAAPALRLRGAFQITPQHAPVYAPALPLLGASVGRTVIITPIS